MWRSARSTSCSRPSSCVRAHRFAFFATDRFVERTTASSSSTRRARASFARAPATSTSRANASARVSSSRNSRLNASSPAPSSRSRASPALTNCPLAIQSPFKRDVHLAGRDRLDHRVFEIRRESRVHLLRQRAFENGDQLLRRAEQIADAQVFAKAFARAVGESAGRSSSLQASAVIVFTSSLPPCKPATRKLARPPLFSRSHCAARTASSGVGTTIDCNDDPSTPSTARSHFASTFKHQRACR
jgi:hypothetical protein